MNALVQFVLKLIGLGDNRMVESLVKGVLLGGNKPADGAAPAAGSNPLEVLMKQFQDKGLGNIFSSWVGTGKNDAITPDQVKDGIGAEQMDAMAKKANLPVDVLAEKLSKYLPGLIDKMTPGGKVPGG
jgi:uncharacterized protein YidB (DUF937 family)